MTQSLAAILVLALPTVFSLPTSASATKRSPLDIKSPDNLQSFHVPPSLHHETPIALSPLLAPHHVARLYHSAKEYQNKATEPDVEQQSQQQLLPLHLQYTLFYPRAVSNVKLTTPDYFRIPVLTHTVSHSSSNAMHPVNVLLPVHLTHGLLVRVPEPSDLPQDPSVIPLQHQEGGTGHLQKLVSSERQERQRSEPIVSDSGDDGGGGGEDMRSPVGGFGTGLTFGGQGAGHGFFAYG